MDAQERADLGYKGWSIQILGWAFTVLSIGVALIGSLAGYHKSWGLWLASWVFALTATILMYSAFAIADKVVVVAETENQKLAGHLECLADDFFGDNIKEMEAE